MQHTTSLDTGTDRQLPCAAEPDLFVPDLNPADAYHQAVRYCWTCPLTAACLQYGIDTASEGMFGAVILAAGGRPSEYYTQPDPYWQERVAATRPKTCRMCDNPVYGAAVYCGDQCRQAGYKAARAGSARRAQATA